MAVVIAESDTLSAVSISFIAIEMRDPEFEKPTDRPVILISLAAQVLFSIDD